MSSFNPDYSMTLGDLLGVDQQGNRITPVDQQGNRRVPMTSPVGGGRNQALINRLEAAQKDSAAQLQQRVDRDRLTDLVETITFARASGIPLSELQGLIRRSDLEASGMVETAEARRRRRMEDKRKTATANRERAEKARAEFRERRASTKAGREAKRAEKAAAKRRARDARMSPEDRAVIARDPFYTSGTVKPDMTPIDVAAENRMMMEDMMDFGPTPAASGPVGEPRVARAPDPRGSKLSTARDPNAPTGRGSRLPTQAELPEGFRDRANPGPYVPPGMSLEDVDAFSANFGPTPAAGSSFTPAERLRAFMDGGRVDIPAGESQARADRFTRQQAAARRAAGLQSLSDVDRMVNSPVGPGGIEGPNISDAELRRRNFTGPRMPLDQELSRIMDFGPNPQGGIGSLMDMTLGDFLDQSTPQFDRPQAPEITVDMSSPRGGGFSARGAQQPYNLQQSPMGQNPQVKDQLNKLRQENSDLSDLDRLQSEIEKRRKLEEKMRQRQGTVTQNAFPGVPSVSQRFGP